MKKYYLAYGSNLNTKEMQNRCPFSKLVGKSVLTNYRLVYKGLPNYSYLTIEKCEGEQTPIGIYEITDSYPDFYNKINISIKLNDIDITAITYIMNQNYNYNLPSLNYVLRCVEGYRNFGFDTNILTNALLTTQQNMSKKLIK